MGITKSVLKRPITTVLAVLCLLVFGLSSVFSSKMELTPEMNFPMMMITAVYAGASPDDVNELITKPIEEMCIRDRYGRDRKGRALSANRRIPEWGNPTNRVPAGRNPANRVPAGRVFSTAKKRGYPAGTGISHLHSLAALRLCEGGVQGNIKLWYRSADRLYLRGH